MLLGAHMSVAGGVHTAFARGESVGCTAMQIFVKNANRWRGTSIPDEHVRLFAAERRRTGIRRVIAHDSYLINLASPRRALRERSISALVDELERCERLELDALVAHPGSHVGIGEARGIARVAKGIDRALARVPGGRVRLLLENTAGQGTNLGGRFEQLAAIRARVREPERVGWCLDTCHAFAAGYDLRTAHGVRAVLDELDRVCGLDALGGVHLNDSLKPLGSRRDRHAHVGEGEIGRAGFGALMRARRLARVPKILETPKGKDLREDARNLELLRALAAGREPPRRRALPTREWRRATLRGRRAGARS